MFATVLNFLVLLTIIFKASPSWGFSFDRTSSYIAKAKTQKLWEHPQWLALGHYEKKYFKYSSPFVGEFFLAADGAQSPEHELIKTIEMLYSEKHQMLQCQYLARAQWLNSVLQTNPQDQLPCEERKAWKKQLNVQGLSIIFAASDMGNAASSFGHTFLKVINPDNAEIKDLIDYGVNYAADANPNEGPLYPLKGLFGLYEGRFTLLPYHQKIREYINLEGRDIWEYHLNFSPEEVDFLINHLIEMEKARAPYYFFSDNCSYQILKTLEVVRPNLRLSEQFKYFTIPIDTVKRLHALPDPIITATKYKKSLKTDYLESYSQLGILEKKALNVAVQKLVIPSDYELSKFEKARVLETAMKFYSLKAFTSDKPYEDEKYKLYIQRASMGIITDETLIKKTEPPEKSHDSSAFYFGVGKTEEIAYSSLKFRHALHDLEQQDFGTVTFSQNEMASIEFRQIAKNDEFTDSGIHKLTFLNLVNLNPVTQLDRNFSWKFRGELINPLENLTNHIFYPDIEASGGYSFDLALFERSRIAFFGTARHWNQNMNSLGPEVLFVSRIFEDLGYSLNLNYFTQHGSRDFIRHRSKFNYTIKKNYDLQFLAETIDKENTNYQMNLVWNFIL